MTLPAQNALAWEICVTIVHVLAIGLTTTRLVHRARTKNIWWDDWVVVIPLVFDVLYLITMWIEAKVTNLPTDVFFSTWFSNIMFLIVVWVSRVSLALSIVRMFPKNHRGRTFGYTLTVIFSILCLANILQTTFDCYGTSPQWWNTPLPLCVAKRKGFMVGVYFAIALDYVADICLTVTPVVLLWKTDLPTRERRLVIGLFFLSIPSLLSSVLFSTLGFIITKLGPSAFLMTSMAGHLQASITLFVSNLLVFVLLFYRIVKNESIEETESGTFHEEHSATDEKASTRSAERHHAV